MKKWLVLALLFTPLASADETAILTAFNDGRYSEAASLARVEATPDSLAFAARSLLAEAMSAPDHTPPEPLMLEAEALARRAVELAPNHIEGRLQLAIALSLRARSMSVREARKSGFGSQAKILAEAVLEEDPDNAYGHGFLAVWHVEVVRRGGSFGSAVMGASVRKARAHYARAIEENPDDASVHWQYARALSALNTRKYRSEIDAALAAAFAATCETQLEHLMQARAEELQTALITQNRREVEALAEQML